jgi:hypothetical protein
MRSDPRIVLRPAEYHRVTAHQAETYPPYGDRVNVFHASARIPADDEWCAEGAYRNPSWRSGQ